MSFLVRCHHVHAHSPYGSKQTTLYAFSFSLYLSSLLAHIHLLKLTQTGTAVMYEPVSQCVLMEFVPPCSHRPVFGEEAPGVPLSSGPPTPLRAQTFSSFSPSKSYSRQSSSSDTELSLTPKTGKIQRPHLTSDRNSVFEASVTPVLLSSDVTFWPHFWGLEAESLRHRSSYIH